MQRTDPLRGEANRSLATLAPLGFTLVEVMVALAVVAVALPALLVTLSQQLDGLRYLEDRTHAQWVAANRLAELRLVLGDWPQPIARECGPRGSVIRLTAVTA